MSWIWDDKRGAIWAASQSTLWRPRDPSQGNVLWKGVQNQALDTFRTDKIVSIYRTLHSLSAQPNKAEREVVCECVCVGTHTCVRESKQQMFPDLFATLLGYFKYRINFFFKQKELFPSKQRLGRNGLRIDQKCNLSSVAVIPPNQTPNFKSAL